MEQLIKDLEWAWKSYREHDDHARTDQMAACLDTIISTCEIIKHKAVNTLVELR